MLDEKPPLPYGPATGALARCAWRSQVLLAQRRIRQPEHHIGRRLRFADGSEAPVYRETVVERPDTTSPSVLVVGFRLRLVQGETGHALFRTESLLNTVLFVGFPGFVSKLWLSHDVNGVYRGVYEWDGPALAEEYVRALWRVLALVSEPGSIHYAVLPGLRRDEVLADPSRVDHVAPSPSPPAWWRLVAVGEPGR